MDKDAILGKLGGLDPYSLDSAIKALDYASNPSSEVVNAVWRLVWSATSLEENYSSHQLTRLINAIFSCLRGALSNPRAQELGISSLLNLARNKDFVEYSGERAAKSAIASMEANDRDVRVQDACINLLERLVTCKKCSSKERIVRLVSETGLKHIMDALKAYSTSNLLLREKAISAIHAVVAASSRDLSAAAKAFNEADGPKLFSKLMDGIYGTKESRESYLKCLETVELLVKAPSCAKTIFESGITGNVSQSIASVKCSPEVLRAALSFLGTAATYGEKFAKLDSIDLIEWVVKILGRESDQGVLKLSARILANVLAGGDPIALARFVELRGLEVVVSILQSDADIDVKIYCSSIVWAVSYNGDVDAQKEILRLKIAKYVADVLRLVIYNRKPIDQPLGALWSLTAMQENADLVRGADGLRLLDEALSVVNYNEEWAEYLLGTLWNMAHATTDPKDMWVFPVASIVRTMSSGRVPINAARLGLGVLANVLPHTVDDLRDSMKECVSFVSKMMSAYPSDKCVNVLCCDILTGMAKNVSTANSANLFKLISQKEVFDCVVSLFTRFRGNIHLRKDAITILHKVSRIRTASASFVGTGLNTVISELRFVSTETVGNEENFDAESAICFHGFTTISLLLRQPQLEVSKVLYKVGFEEVISNALKKFQKSKRALSSIVSMTWNYVTEVPAAGDKLLAMDFCKVAFEGILPKLDPADDVDTKNCAYTLNAIVVVLAPVVSYGKYMKKEYTNFVGELLGKYPKNTQIRFLLNTLLRNSNRTSNMSICSNIPGGECKEQCDYRKKSGYCEKCCRGQEGYRCNTCNKIYCLYCRKNCAHMCVEKTVVQPGIASADKFSRVFVPFVCSCRDKKCKGVNSLAQPNISQQQPQKIQKISTK